MSHLEKVAERCSDKEPPETARLRYIIGACHDLGKATSYFQEYLFEERGQSPKTNHSAISSLATFFALRADGFSHRECAMGWVVVARHHSPLINTGGDSGIFQRMFFAPDAPTEAYSAQAKDLRTRSHTVQNICDSLDVPLDIERFCEWVISSQYLRDLCDSLNYGGSVSEQPLESSFQTIQLFSQLVAADKLTAAGYSLPPRQSIPSNAVQTYIDDTFGTPVEGTINQLRSDAQRQVRDQLADLSSVPDVLTLTLPTGSGKTLTVFDVALQLREMTKSGSGPEPRVVYALPFTSIIDQNFAQYRDVLDHAGVNDIPEILLKHHYRSRHDYMTNSSDTDDNFWRDLMLTNRWESEIITTTFVQLLESLLVPSNRQSLKLPNLRNSIVILDEVQAIPVQYWDVVRQCFEHYAETWNTTFIAMTATQPGIFGDEHSLVPNPSKYNNQLDRVTFHIDDSVNGEPRTLRDVADRAINHASRESHPDVLVVCNTISSARQVFEFVEQALEGRRSLQLEYLSSSVRPLDRQQRVSDLRTTSDNQRVVVSTQVIEAGVDLDFDLVIRDFGPLDSIVQVAGRCKRHQLSAGGRVELVSAVDDDGNQPATLIYDSPRLDATRRVLAQFSGKNNSIAESTMTTTTVETYFDELDAVKQTDKSIAPLSHWQFEDAKLTLIPDSFSADIYVVGVDRPGSDIDLYNAYTEAVRENNRSRVQKLKPEFFERVVSVNLYSPDSERATAIRKLPLPDDAVDVYQLPAHRPRYNEWYNQKTGFQLPESTVEARLL